MWFFVAFCIACSSGSFLLGALCAWAGEKTTSKPVIPAPAPTYDEMKQDVPIIDADHIMRIGTA